MVGSKKTACSQYCPYNRSLWCKPQYKSVKCKFMDWERGSSERTGLYLSRSSSPSSSSSNCQLRFQSQCDSFSLNELRPLNWIMIKDSTETQLALFWSRQSIERCLSTRLISQIRAKFTKLLKMKRGLLGKFWTMEKNVFKLERFFVIQKEVGYQLYAGYAHVQYICFTLCYHYNSKCPPQSNINVFAVTELMCRPINKQFSVVI